jgi:hypothetical protein
VPFLVYTGFKLAFGKDAEVDPDKNPLVNFTKRFIPVTPDFAAATSSYGRTASVMQRRFSSFC